MDFYKTQEGKSFLKHLDKVDFHLDTMQDVLETLSIDMRYDYDEKLGEDESFEDTEKGQEMWDKIEAIIDLKDEIEDKRETIKDLVLYDNEAFNDAY